MRTARHTARSIESSTIPLAICWWFVGDRSMVSAIVREIDIEARRIVIDPPEGLLD